MNVTQQKHRSRALVNVTLFAGRQDQYIDKKNKGLLQSDICETVIVASWCCPQQGWHLQQRLPKVFMLGHKNGHMPSPRVSLQLVISTLD